MINVYNIVTRTLEVTFWTLMRSVVIGVDNLCLFDLVLNPKCCQIKATFGDFQAASLSKSADKFGNNLVHEHVICRMKKSHKFLWKS